MPQTRSSITKSQSLFKRACDLIPGGVNSPVRTFKSVGGEPIFIKRAQGPYIWDEDGNRYIDFVGSWGPMILGHADPDIEEAVISATRSGTSFGAPTELENLMAEEVIKLVPSIEMVRFVNSGTEAVMSAIRLARAYTTTQNGAHKTKIIKFTGCYHGHVDALLAQAGSGLATLGMPGSSGVTAQATADTIVIPFNDTDLVARVFEEHGKDISALITEPIIGNSGFILPRLGFLEFLRKITREHNALLIFDEVMTGFRVALGGAQERFGISPDITTLGKVIGGGLPVGAYGASREIMSLVAPLGPMYQAGTLSGNPLAMSAGLACLRKIQRPGFFEDLESKSRYFMDGFRASCQISKNPAIKNVQCGYAGGMFGFFFSERPINSYEDACANIDADLFKRFYLATLEQGVYLAPSAYEAGFMSSAHSQENLDQVIQAITKTLSYL